MGLFQRGKEGLQPSEVSNQFEDPEDPGDANQTQNFTGLSNDVEFRQVIKHEGEEIGQDGKQVHQVQRLNEKVQLAGGAAEPDDVLQGEVDGREGIDPHDGVVDKGPDGVHFVVTYKV